MPQRYSIGSLTGHGTTAIGLTMPHFNHGLAMLHKYMMKKLRPKAWKVQGEIPHKQYGTWLQMRAQANYRGEVFLLSFAEYQQVWLGMWDRRGRGKDDYCLAKIDPEGSWQLGNIEVLPRVVFLQRKNSLRRGKKNGANKISNRHRIDFSLE